MIGTTIRQYRIIAKLGEGGMGEVFRATDMRLQRAVAIKSLPLHAAADPDRAARFEREAQALAALAHPGIAGIYELLEHEERRLLVLELVEGETLAARVRRGPIPVEEALPIARQIAEALEVAHEKGIVHRDLKPANIALTPEGAVKLLDFGLAIYRAQGVAAGVTGDAANSPTYAMTEPGVILGTPAYMSPEQARGKPVDRRADIWAFGCVVFEMLTGSAPFAGETVSDIIGAVLRMEPDWKRMPPDVPPFVRRMLRRCLVKDPRDRLPHIGAARLELQEGVDDAAPDVGGSAARSSRRAWMAMWLAIAALGVGVAAWSMWSLLTRTPPKIGLVRFNLQPPPGTALLDGSEGHLALSRDGRMVAFVTGTIPDHRSALWVTSMSSPDARMLPGTEGAAFPFWSPDGSELAFFAGGSLKKVALLDGALTTLCPAPDPRGGSWGTDGTILFAAGPESPIWQVSASGGSPRRVTSVEGGTVAHSFPSWTGEGDSFLYLSRAPAGGSTARLRWLATGDDGAILETPWRVTYASGHLFTVGRALDTAERRGEQLYARRFDVRSRALRGEPRLIAESVAVGPAGAAFDTSDAGVLLFRSALVFNQPFRLVWRSRDGSDPILLDSPRPFYRLALSPDGLKAVVQIHEGDAAADTADLWMYDLTRPGARTRFTSEPGAEQSPAWSPDGKYVAYTAAPVIGGAVGEVDVWVRDARGAEPPRLVATGGGTLRGWAPDGKAVLTIRTAEGTNGDVWLVPLDGAPARPIVQTRAGEYDARFSPDGRWLAYTSNEGTRTDVYVQPYPSTGQRWDVTPNGGQEPGWSADSRELYFTSLPERGAPEHLMAVTVLSDEPRFSLPRRILERALASNRFVGRYAASPDGKRFLIIAPDTDLANREMPITLVLNWQRLLQDE